MTGEPSAPRLEAAGLMVERGDRRLLRGASLSLLAGEAIELVGPNGCGKTTLLRVLAGLVRPDEGEVRWCGEPISRSRSHWHGALAWLGHLDGVKPELTAFRNLAVDGHPEGAVLATLERVGLAPQCDVESGRLSAGQRRRLALARVVLSQRLVWLMDEPFTALDVAGRALVRALMAAHVGAGGLLVYSNHHDEGLAGARRMELPLAPETLYADADAGPGLQPGWPGGEAGPGASAGGTGA